MKGNLPPPKQDKINYRNIELKGKVKCPTGCLPMLFLDLLSVRLESLEYESLLF